MNCSVCHAAMFAIGPSLEFPCVDAFFHGQCSRCDSSRLRRRLSAETSSFLLISFKRVFEDSHRPRRWKQWSHTASDILDSDSPDQPKSANAKATMSEGVDGRVDDESVELNRVGGMRWRISSIDGLG